MKVNKKVGAVAGLGVLAVVGGTFAYYSQSSALDNPFHTGYYDNAIVENYTPPTDNIEAGAEIKKEVGAVNTGTYPVLVRIKMDEVWTRVTERNADGSAKTTQEIKSMSSGIETGEGDNKTVLTNEGFNPDSASKGWEASETTFGPEGNKKKFQADKEDGQVDADAGTVVYKKLTSNSKWKDGGDGYWYYQGVLEPEKGTGNLMDSLYVAGDIDLGKYTNNYYYAIGEENWKLAGDGKIMNGSIEANPTWQEYEVEYDRTDKTKVTALKVKNGTATISIGDENKDGKIDAIDMAKALKEANPAILKDKQQLFRKNDSEVETVTETKDGVTVEKKLLGYADANYTLTITSEFIQATEAAVVDGWKLDKTTIASKAGVTVKEDGDIVTTE